MKIWLLTLILIMTSLVHGQTYRRLVNFEWEPIPDAKFYEIEIRKRSKEDKSSSFVTTQAAWNGRLPIGFYEFRLRALDRRKVPGEWSEFAELDVGLEPVSLVSPLADASINAQGDTRQEVEFKWQATPMAKDYLIEIYNDQNEKIAEKTTAETSFKHSLTVASQYSWRIKAVAKDKIESSFTELQKFTLVGGPLEKASIEKPDNDFVREIKWKAVENAESYDVIIARYNPTLKKWQKFKEFENLKDTSLNFAPDWEGGRYRFILKSKAAKRQDSALSSLNFKVREGDRSPAAEYVQTLRKSIDRAEGWFAVGSWYASSIAMDTKYRNALGIKADAVTGTGRLGVGWLDPDSRWGFLGTMEASGYIFENRIYNFIGLEMSGIRRQQVSARGDLRYSFGVFAKEFPALWTSSDSANANFMNTNNVSRQYSKGSVLGPQAGVEYWYSLTPKFGLQVNAQLAIPVAGFELPNGGKIKSGSDFNYSLGALGSYRYSSQLTGLVGLNYRSESYNYTDSSNKSGWSSGYYSGQYSDDVNTSISGIYINLMAEFSF